ncbi:YceI family protein [Rhodocytophaga rosea]|uniref:YceI family protein n=1 Tax=Rhodocytophaga rosea TaxID=2704465 RepID=A0A6C0GVE7_9BACT|nr:YceI family protein [Rhodocytophaga rosea]QHT71784.1 YceI family protein [Rhodocytophaga rosea]
MTYSPNYIRYLSIAAILLVLTAFIRVNWKLKHSTVTFKIKHAGLLVNGSLASTQANINFDPANLAQSTIVASVETNTIETGIALRNKHLRKEQYLHVDKFPRITMRSTRMEKTGSQDYLAYFDLTIKGTTKNIQVPFRFVENACGGDFKAEFSLNRLDYKVRESSWLMDNEVQVFIQLNVTR